MASLVRDVTKITSAENTSTSKTEEAEKCYCDSGCCAKKYAESYTTYCELLGIDDGATAVPYIDTGKEIIARHH